MKTPKWDDTESIEDQIPSFDETEDISEPSKLESVARGAGQGLTLGFLDEMMATLGTTGGSPTQYLSDPEAAAKKDQAGLAQYDENLKEERSKDLAAREANPASYTIAEIASGIIPGLVSGGGAAVANVGKGLAKEALEEGAKVSLKEAAKTAAKTGAGYGAVSGAGYSEADNAEDLLKDIAIGTGAGATLGAGLPVLGKGFKSAVKGAASPIKAGLEKVKALPIVEDFINSASLAAKGRSVLGDKNYKKILQESKDIIKDELQPLINRKDKDFSRAIGKVIKKVDSFGNKKDLTKDLGKIEKQISNIIKNKKVPEESKDVLEGLLDTINNYKKTSTSVSSAKNVKTGTETALQSLQSKMEKVTLVGKELGEEVRFSDPKVNAEKGIVSVVDTTSGKVITSPIKSGEFTPIKYGQQSNYEEMGVGTLKSLLQSAREYQTKAGRIGGLVKKPVGKAVSAVQEGIEELAEGANLKPQMKFANKEFGKVRDLQEILPADILKGTKVEKDAAIDKVAQFLRKQDSDGMGGDDLRDAVMRFEKQLRQVDPKFADRFIEKTADISKRYDLARTAKESFGQSILGTGQAASVISGSLLGSAARTAAAPVKTATNAVEKLSKGQLTSLGNKLLSTDNKGASHFGQQLVDLAEKEGMARSQAMWALSQSPAFRKILEKQIPALEEDMQQSIEGFTGQEAEETMELPTLNVPMDDSSEDDLTELENDIDRVNQQQSSGDNIPVDQLESLLGKISSLRIAESDKDELENDAVTMTTFQDGLELKRKIQMLKDNA